MSDTSSEMEHPLFKEDFHSGYMHDNITEVDLFLENCSSLYNLILDSIHDLSSKSVTWQSLDEMAKNLADVSDRIGEDHPEMAATIELRINTINSAMEQLRIKRAATSDTESCSSRSQGSSDVRNWIHSIESRLTEHEGRLQQRNANKPAIVKLLADQQVLQLEIQTEGQQHITRLYQQFRTEAGYDDLNSESHRRKKSTLDAIRKKWHTVYLNSLGLQFRIEELINRYQEASDSESDPDLAGPPSKRIRRNESESEVDEDTLPFAESEYESIMDGRTTVTSSSSEDSPLKVKKWDSQQQDIGYSSGEASVHEAVENISKETSDNTLRKSPSKSFYRMVMDDIEDPDHKKEVFDSFTANPLTDSMYVNYGENSILLPDYDEVMALLNDDDLLPKDDMNTSFNTKWREIRGRQSMRRERPSREMLDLIAKQSCDASSEDSSDWEQREEEMFKSSRNLMSQSLNAEMLEGSNHSLKRQRGGRSKNNSLLLETSLMESSFCSTRSELPPCLSRSLRKKLRVRRMPRSMSDGEQLGVKSGLLTPSIRISPPRTPLYSSTRLLQQLDLDLLQGAESDSTVPEQSDAPAYEWDEYHPPEKDDSVPDLMSSVCSSRIPDEMMDEDFGSHFSGLETLERLFAESSAHLKLVENCIENGDIEPKQMANIELICRTNLRNLDNAIQMGPLRRDVSELRQLRLQWSRLLSQMASPATQLLSKVGRFASSLRDLHDLSSVSLLNGMNGIKSRDDAIKALEALKQIQMKLNNERKELRSILDSKLFRDELSEVSSEFDCISAGYDDAVGKIDCLVDSLQKINQDWSSWSQQQTEIRQCMSVIEEKLKATNVDQTTVMEQMELCQERMNSLETMCNYLTSSVISIHEGAKQETLPDFQGEIKLYANALEQLKSRFHDLTRVPSPPTPSTPLATSTPLKERRVKTKTIPTQTTPTVIAAPKMERPASLGKRIYRTVSGSFWIKSLLTMSLLSALAALFWAGILGRSFGPHLTYVNGPPPT